MSLIHHYKQHFIYVLVLLLFNQIFLLEEAIHNMHIDHEQLAKSLDKLPAFPQSVSKILELTANVDVAPKDLVAVVERDIVLTAKVLKLVNSAYFGLAREVTSVPHAVVYVGINTIKNVAISAAMAGSLPKNNQAGLDMDDFWKQSLTVAVIAKLLAEKKGVEPNHIADYFVTGLLFNIGKIIVAHFYPDEYREVIEQIEIQKKPAFVIERELLGIDHSEIGAMLGEAWQLPQNLIAGIKNHHNWQQEVLSNNLPITILVANQIYKRLNKTEQDYVELPENIKIWMGCDFAEMLESLTNLDKEIEKAMLFIS